REKTPVVVGSVVGTPNRSSSRHFGATDADEIDAMPPINTPTAACGLYLSAVPISGALANAQPCNPVIEHAGVCQNWHITLSSAQTSRRAAPASTDRCHRCQL